MVEALLMVVAMRVIIVGSYSGVADEAKDAFDLDLGGDINGKILPLCDCFLRFSIFPLH